MRGICLAAAAFAVVACIQPPENEPRPLPYPGGTAQPLPAAQAAPPAGRDTAVTTTAAAPRTATPATTQQEIEAEREAIRRELAERRARLDSIGRDDSLRRVQAAGPRVAAARDTAARTPPPRTAAQTPARDTAARPPAQAAQPAARTAAQTPARDTAARPAAQPAPQPAARTAAQQEMDAEREAIRRELAMRRARLDSLGRADSIAQVQASARRAAALDSAEATVARATPPAAAAARATPPAATPPAAAAPRATTPPAAAAARPPAAAPAAARRAATPPAAPRPDNRTPVELRLDSTNALVVGAMNITSEAMTQAQIATAERQQERIVAAMETLQQAARQSQWHAQTAMAQGDMLGVLLTAPGQSAAMATEYDRYWQLARAKLDTTRVRAGLAAQMAEAAAKCEEEACARTQATAVRDHMIAASGAAREADGFLRLAMRNVR